jgi:hypothetical protein
MKRSTLGQLKRIKLLMGAFLIVLDQCCDISLAIIVFLKEEHLFATIYLLVEFLPAALTVWHMLK